ncbi:magnesium and cobalt transport protein CorA [Halothece sp. PCC 7418]|uniref:magnesium/cobalt transporter CorA n=1 Tax=Halothece sp. (strain PCC 7418) TaxID=65093 RepID=UPI0002A064C7|nr:magnesium/cobalt transporter CorA [Halothece sp. PCC 7418]AFZ42262.1 magnesium and cobalt transport protein CorA [Halothece sp. PCC 7418]
MTQFPSFNPDFLEDDKDKEDYFDFFFDLPGSEPGTLWIEEDAAPSQLILIDYDAKYAVRKVNIDPLKCEHYLASESASWLDIQGLGSEDILKQIGQIFKLHPLLLEDVVNVPQRPKVEDYNEQLIIIVHLVQPKPEEDGFYSEQVSFVLGKKYLLTFQEEPNHDCFNPVRARLKNNKGKIRTSGVDYLTYLLLDTIIDSFFPVLEDYGERIEQLEDEVVFNPNRRTLEKIYKVRRELLALRRAIWPQQSVITTLMRSGSNLISSDVEIYFRDCYDHVIQLLDIVESYRELSSSLMDVYLSSMSNKMNEVMKVLTIISSIFIPLSFIAGVYGMNFQYMPELEWKWGYYICLGVMGAIALSLIIFFWRNGWLERFYPVATSEEKAAKRKRKLRFPRRRKQ